jgi:hypothetical protein
MISYSYFKKNQTLIYFGLKTGETNMCKIY